MSMPNATPFLWETARKEAGQVQEIALEIVRADRNVREDELETEQVELGDADKNLDWVYAVSPRLSRYSRGLNELSLRKYRS